MHKDEAPVRYRLGDLPARGGPDERILVTVDGEHRLADPGDTALIARGCVDEPTRKLAADAYAGLTEFFIRGLTDAAQEALAVLDAQFDQIFQHS